MNKTLIRGNNLIKRVHPYNNNPYFEVLQIVNCSFSIAEWDKTERRYIQQYIPFKCRDYFTEVFYQKYFMTSRVYGFKAINPFTDTSVITIESEHPEGIIYILSLINNLEDKLFGKISNHMLSSDESTLIIRPIPFWFSNVCAISLFSFLLRMGVYHSTEGCCGDDINNYIDSCFDTITPPSHATEHIFFKEYYKHNLSIERLICILKKVPPNIMKYPFKGTVQTFQHRLTTDSLTIHNYSGIASLLTGINLYIEEHRVSTFNIYIYKLIKLISNNLQNSGEV